MANILYPSFKLRLMDGSIDLDSDVFKFCLLTAAHTPSLSHTVYSDISGQEVVGTGYTVGGRTLENKTVALVSTNGVWDADDVSWTGSTISARYGVIYDTTASNYLVVLLDFGGVRVTNNGTFSYVFNSLGILRIS